MLIPTEQLITELQALARVSNLSVKGCEVCEQAATKIEMLSDTDKENIFMAGYEACRERLVDIFTILNKKDYNLSSYKLAKEIKVLHPSQPSPELGEEV